MSSKIARYVRAKGIVPCVEDKHEAGTRCSPLNEIVAEVSKNLNFRTKLRTISRSGNKAFGSTLRWVCSSTS